MPTPEDLTPRFRLLIDELGRRLEHKRGWKTRVAEQLGVYPPEIPKILGGSRRIGWAVAAKASARIGLDQRFFTDDDPQRWLRAQALAADPLSGEPAMSLDRLRAEARTVRRATWTRPAEVPAMAKELAARVLRSELVVAANVIAVGRPADESLATTDLLNAIQLPDLDPADAASEQMAVVHPKSTRDENSVAMHYLSEHVTSALRWLSDFASEVKLRPDDTWFDATAEQLGELRRPTPKTAVAATIATPQAETDPAMEAILEEAIAGPGRRQRERAKAALQTGRSKSIRSGNR